MNTGAPPQRAGTAPQLLATRNELKEQRLDFKKSMPENVGIDTRETSRARAAPKRALRRIENTGAQIKANRLAQEALPSAYG